MCNFCKKSFHTYSILRDHVKSKHGAPRYQCTRCGERFQWRQTFWRHKNTKCPVYLGPDMGSGEDGMEGGSGGGGSDVGHFGDI